MRGGARGALSEERELSVSVLVPAVQYNTLPQPCQNRVILVVPMPKNPSFYTYSTVSNKYITQDTCVLVLYKMMFRLLLYMYGSNELFKGFVVPD